MNRLAVASSATLPMQVEHDAIAEAARIRLDQGARIVRIKAAGLGIDRHAFKARLAIRRQRDRKAFRLAHRRLVEAQAPFGRFRIGRHQQRAAVFGPIHRTNIERGILGEALDAVLREAEPGVGRDHGLEMHGFRRGIHARAMQVEIGRHALEGAGAVEHRRAQPGGVVAHAHDRHIALVPIAFVEGPGLRPALSRHCNSPPPVARSYVTLHVKDHGILGGRN